MSEKKHYPYIGGAFDRIIYDGDGSVWVKERACKPILAEDGFACDKCGYWWPLKHYDNGKPRYCPNCGARVLSEEEQGHMVADAIRRLEKAVER